MRRSRMSRLLTSVPARLSAVATRYRNLAQIIAGAFAIGLGFWGWVIVDKPVDFAGYVNSFFRTIQLVTLQFSSPSGGALPWQLQVARLLVPLVAVAASFHVLVGAIARPFRLALLPHTQDHIIVCGEGQLTEAALLNLVERGEQIVVVGPWFDPVRRGALEGYGLTVMEANPEQSATWQSLNLETAAALFLTGANDLTNLNLAMTALQATKNRGADRAPLVLAVLIEREDLATELDAALDGLARQNGVRYQRLCPDKEGVRLELAAHAPVFTKEDKDAASHVLIVGLSGQWEQVIGQIVLSTQDHPFRRPVLTFIVKPNEAASLEKWRADKPDLDLVAEIVTVAVGQRLLPDTDLAREWRLKHGTPHLAVILAEETEAVAIALALRRPDGDFAIAGAPILVKQKHEDRLLSALGSTRLRDRQLSGLFAFGGLIRADSIARVLDRKNDDVAIAVHVSYLDTAKDLPPGSPAAIAAWEELTENLRDANRALADHAPILLASQALDARVDPATLPPATVDRLARIEHRRWMAERIMRGWRYGAVRDNTRRIHPSIVNFDALSPAEQEKDARSVAALLRAKLRASA